MRASDRLDLLAAIADEQHGHVTTAQAERVGVSRVELARLAERGRVERVERGVYRMQGSGLDEFADVRAAWLALDPAATAEQRLASDDPIVVSHASAARIHGIGDLVADDAEFTAMRRVQTVRGGIRIHRGEIASHEIQTVDGLPVTTARRTIVDLVADGHDGEHVGAVIADAVRRGFVTLDGLADDLAPYAARRGHRRLDGAALLDALLEATGLDRESLVRDLVTSGWANTLVTIGALAGAESVLGRIAQYDALRPLTREITSPLPQLTAPMSPAMLAISNDIAKAISGSLAGLIATPALADSMKPLHAAISAPALEAIARIDMPWLPIDDVARGVEIIEKLSALSARAEPATT